MANYEQRFVAFLDILGFSDLVRKSEENDDTFIKLANITHGIDEKVKTYRPKNGGKKILQDFSQVDILSFSDSIVLSHAENSVGFWKIIFIVNTIFYEIAQYGTVCRGAITVGPFYQRDKIAFGPALIDAYHLESNIAKVPRVLSSGSAFAKIQEYAGNEVWAADYLTTWIVRDSDGAAYVDWFGDCRQIFSSGDCELISLYTLQMNLICQEIQRQLYSNFDKPHVFEKYSWFADKFNLMVSKCKTYAPTLSHIDVFGVAPNHVRLRDPFEL